MSLGRLLRTVRHLTVEQVVFSVVRQARHAVWRRRPDVAASRIATRAARLPHPDPYRPAIGAIAARVALLQKTIHPEPPSALRSGRFSIFGHDFNLGDLRAVDWRCDFDDDSSPLRRLTLAYCGWVVPLLADGAPGDVGRVAQAIEHLDAIRWSEPEIFRDLWNPYTVSHRLINLLCGLNLYGRRESAADEGPARLVLLDHIRRCAAFIASDPERDLQANHLFKNWTALAVFAAATPEPPSTFPALTAAIERSLDQLVLPDGGHAERSPMYHALGLLDVECIAASGSVPGLSPRLDADSARMRRALAVMSHPDGDIALFNDAWLGGTPSPQQIGAPSADGTSVLSRTGYVRLGGEGDAVILDCGPCGLDQQPGHAHADFLAAEVSVRGQRFIVDPGTPTYVPGNLRDRCRSAALHNGPHIAGLEPIEFWKAFRVGRRASAGGLHDEALAQAPLWCAGWHDGYSSHGTEPRRWIGLWPGRGLLIVDVWKGAVTDRAKSFFLIPEEWTMTGAEGGVAFDGPARIRVEALAGHLEVSRTVWWPRYGVEKPATGLCTLPYRGAMTLIGAISFTWGERTPVDSTMLAALERGLMAARKTDPAGYQA